jgi:hypothetical protein
MASAAGSVSRETWARLDGATLNLALPGERDSFGQRGARVGWALIADHGGVVSACALLRLIGRYIGPVCGVVAVLSVPGYCDDRQRRYARLWLR